MSIRPEIARAIHQHPARDMHNVWRHDAVGTTARLFLEQEPRVVGITPEETMRLMNLLVSKQDEHGANSFKLADGLDISVGGREIRVERNRWRASAIMPGLWLDEAMPMDETANDLAVAQINDVLRRLGHKPAVTGARTPERGYDHAFHTTMVVAETPEAKGEYELYSHYAHRPAEMRRHQSQRIAHQIALRIDNKATVLRLRREAGRQARELVKDVDGMRVVGTTFTLESWRAGVGKHNEFAGSAYAQIEMLNDNLKPTTITSSVKDKDSVSHLRTRINQHRKRMRMLGDRKPEKALTCEPILANALRALQPRFIPDMLAEIERAVVGGGARANNPVLRGIANVSVREGMLTAPVAIGRGGRFIKERVNVKTIRQLPEAVLLSMPGRTMTDLVDHPLLAGLVIKSVTINAYGLQLRPESAAVPLEGVIADLRARNPKGQP